MAERWPTGNSPETESRYYCAERPEGGCHDRSHRKRLPPFWNFAHRFLCASAMRLRAAALNVRFRRTPSVPAAGSDAAERPFTRRLTSAIWPASRQLTRGPIIDVPASGKPRSASTQGRFSHLVRPVLTACQHQSKRSGSGVSATAAAAGEYPAAGRFEGRHISLLVSGNAAPVPEAGGIIRITVPSILDHEVIGIDVE